ncbi:hypothetical protein Pcinc_001290 [Petrolisthes cinctipes]|uniref:Reverse transcriptase/retrotransposon-derived protein RNase H-like domain-containing protein n=1 Tax=Petrolisthes cinctipes TaxID=88211 RepID=A0AAE1L4Q1_PETCI|nr:hypothetical protein Pcinc_001290 [Petrolisthes cinctipes]
MEVPERASHSGTSPLDSPSIPVPVSFYIKDPPPRTSFLIDTGAQFSILPAKSIDRKHVSAITLKAANVTTFKTYGSTRLAVSLGLRRKFNWSCILADVENAIIGCDFLSHFDLSVRPHWRQIVDNSTNLAMQGGSPLIKQEVSHHVTHCITTSGSPVFCRPQRLDSARLKIVKDEFQYMLDQGIIRPNILDPVHNLLVEKRRGIKDTVKWTPSAEEAFNSAKAALASATSLHHPDPTVQMGLFTDVSSTSMRAVLQPWHNVSDTPNIDFKEMALLQSKDPEFRQLAKTSLKIIRQSVRDHDSLELICDDSTGTVRPIVPKDMRKSVFLVLHIMSHPGHMATFKLVSRRYLKFNGIKWTPLHLSQLNTVLVLAESASHQFDSSWNHGEGPVAVHSARANNLFVLKCRGRDSSDLQQYSRPRGSSRTQPLTEQHVVNMAEPHVITRGIKAPAAVHSGISLPGSSSLG